MVELGPIHMKCTIHSDQCIFTNQWEDFTCKQILVLLAWKGVRKEANFPMQLFAILFSSTIFLQFFNILGTESKNKIWKWPFLTKDMNFLNLHSLALSGQNASTGEISITFLFLPALARWNPPIGYLLTHGQKPGTLPSRVIPQLGRWMKW
jgi:hypothetical protein